MKIVLWAATLLLSSATSWATPIVYFWSPDPGAGPGIQPSQQDYATAMQDLEQMHRHVRVSIDVELDAIQIDFVTLNLDSSGRWLMFPHETRLGTSERMGTRRLFPGRSFRYSAFRHDAENRIALTHSANGFVAMFHRGQAEEGEILARILAPFQELREDAHGQVFYYRRDYLGDMSPKADDAFTAHWQNRVIEKLENFVKSHTLGEFKATVPDPGSAHWGFEGYAQPKASCWAYMSSQDRRDKITTPLSQRGALYRRAGGR